MSRDTKIIALAGKGGVGKTSISAAFVRTLCEMHPDSRILAIDADPAVGLATALGVEVKETVDDLRNDVIEQVQEGAPRRAIEMLGEARYHIYDALVEAEKFCFLAIGRPESAGCYCKVNTYLKQVISMLAGEFDYVVIDGEAGIEQINRRVMEKVTHLILITDPSKKGISVIETIKDVADKLVRYDKVGAIVNRVSNPEMKDFIKIKGIEILSFIGDDLKHAVNDIQGLTVFDLPEDSMILTRAREALVKLSII